MVAILATMGVLLWPRLMPMILPAAGLLAVIAVLSAQGAWRSVQPGPVTICLTMFGVYLLINALWSIDPSRAFAKAGLFFLFFVAAYCAIHAVREMESILAGRLAIGFAVAVILSAAIVLAELLSERAIVRSIYSLLPALSPTNPKDITISDGAVVWLSPHNLNRNITVLNMILWPALLASHALPNRRQAMMLVVGLLALTTMATFASEHLTSMIALAFAAIAFVAFQLWPNGARAAIAIGWVAATLFVVPAAHIAYERNLHMAHWLPVTARARIILWEHTARQVEKRPLLGVGLASTRKFHQQQIRQAEMPPGHVYPFSTGRHAHNIYLQTWYELGLVGASLLLALGLALMSWIARLPARVEGFLLCGFVSSAVIGAFGWGMWQSWFMAAWFFVAVFATFSIASARQ